MEPGPPTPYGRVVRPKDDPNAVATPLPPDEKVYMPVPERWDLPLPDWDRYGVRGDYPYVSGHWWDPFNQNKLKGDYPDPRQADLLQLHRRQRHAARGAQPADAERRQHRAARRRAVLRPRRRLRAGHLGPDVPRSLPRRHGVPPDRLARPLRAGLQRQLRQPVGVQRRQRRRAPPGHAARSSSRRAGALRREEALRHRPSLRLHLGAGRDPGVHVRLPRLHGGARGPRACACSARSTRAASNTTSRCSTRWRKTPTAASTRCTAATSRSTSPTSTSRTS